jgi:hypothetical protein
MRTPGENQGQDRGSHGMARALEVAVVDVPRDPVHVTSQVIFFPLSEAWII